MKYFIAFSSVAAALVLSALVQTPTAEAYSFVRSYGRPIQNYNTQHYYNPYNYRGYDSRRTYGTRTYRNTYPTYTGLTYPYRYSSNSRFGKPSYRTNVHASVSPYFSSPSYGLHPSYYERVYDRSRRGRANYGYGYTTPHSYGGGYFGGGYYRGY